MMNEYEKQASDFLKKNNAEIKIEYLKTGKHFDGDKEDRDIYIITIKRDKKEYNFNFGDSIVNTEKNQEKQRSYLTGIYTKTGRRKQVVTPSSYDILACLQKYEVGDFDEFCSDYGYEFRTEREMVKIKQIYFAVSDEYKNVMRLFGDCIDELQEIN